MKMVVAFGAGLLFAVGLAVSGMTQPQRIIGFLDFFGTWDPTLSFVMVGAIGVYLPGARWVTRRGRPLAAESLQIPTSKDITLPLLLGSAVFGLGWGLAGLCPGPALTSLPAGSPNALAVVGGMVAGMYLYSPMSRGLSAGASRLAAVGDG